jgi:hypothetical protein
MMKSLSGPKSQDPILADIQRAFASGYHTARRKNGPSELARTPVADLYARVSELGKWERRRYLASLCPAINAAGHRVKLSA